MRKLLLPFAILSLFVVGASSSPAAAECYGDAASMFGCGPQEAPKTTTRGGTLETFGASESPVLPNTGYSTRQGTASDIVTVQESNRMLKSIVLGRTGGGRLSQRAHNRAINSSAQPLRPAGAVTLGSMASR